MSILGPGVKKKSPNYVDMFSTPGRRVRGPHSDRLLFYILFFLLQQVVFEVQNRRSCTPTIPTRLHTVHRDFTITFFDVLKFQNNNDIELRLMQKSLAQKYVPTTDHLK